MTGYRRLAGEALALAALPLALLVLPAAGRAPQQTDLTARATHAAGRQHAQRKRPPPKHPTGPAPVIRSCGTVVGAPYTYTYSSGETVSGDVYVISVENYPCNLAELYSVQYSHDDPKVFVKRIGQDLLYNPPGRRLAHWPKHFVCAGLSYTPELHAPPAVTGFCYKGPISGPTAETDVRFGWETEPKLG